MENTLWNKVILSNFPDTISTFIPVNKFTFSRAIDTMRNPCFLTRTVRPKNIRPFPAFTVNRLLGLQFLSDAKFMLHCAVVMTVHPLRSRCRTYSSRSLEPISSGIFICTNTYFIVANTSKTKYNNLRLKFVSEFKCYMEFRLRPFSFLFTQLSVGFNVVSATLRYKIRRMKTSVLQMKLSLLFYGTQYAVRSFCTHASVFETVHQNPSAWSFCGPRRRLRMLSCNVNFISTFTCEYYAFP